MIHPASDKYVALTVKAGEALEQGSVVRFTEAPDGTLQIFKANATADVSNFGTFLAYYITADSQDVEYVGAVETTTFTLNTDTGVGGGMQVIPSGSECAALGGSGVALIRMDRYSLYNDPSDLTSYTVGTVLKVHSDGFLALDADDDLNVVSALVVQNEGQSIVVLLA
jgi:hypothetical protein